MLLLFTLISIVVSDDYYQVIDKYVYNFKGNNEKISENFYFTGDVILYNDSIKLTHKLNNTFGMINTINEIHSDSEIQIVFKINPQPWKGSALVVWIYKDDPINENHSFLGFHKNFNGAGVMIITPQSEINPFSWSKVCIIRNNGTNSNLKELIHDLYFSSCDDKFYGRETKLTIRIIANQLSILYNNTYSVNSLCFSKSTLIGDNFIYPYKIGISSINGYIDDYINGFEALDSVEITKITIFNLERGKKHLYPIEKIVKPLNLSFEENQFKKLCNISDLYIERLLNIIRGYSDEKLFYKKEIESLEQKEYTIESLVNSIDFIIKIKNNLNDNKISDEFETIIQDLLKIHVKLKQLSDKILNIKQIDLYAYVLFTIIISIIVILILFLALNKKKPHLN